MSKTKTNPNGRIAWTDLTVPNVEEIWDFHSQVVGWHPEPVDMGDYHDLNMRLGVNGEPVVGICHARGMNADLPPVWLIYLTVDEVDASASLCEELEGRLIVLP
jgi:predicted enzyme related to lactoylglutathione lyase